MIDILLSTYNGEAYLSEQLTSILNNTCRDFRILVRDDGSSDRTVDIVRDFASAYPEKVFLIEDGKGNLGPTKSFEALARCVTSDYFMFSDQDDFWCDRKIEHSLNCLQALERAHEPGTPCLAFTDLYVVDKELHLLNDSFIRSNRLDAGVIGDIHKTLALSVAPGCTMIMNRFVLERVFPFPAEVTHDFWVMILTVRYGAAAFLDEPTIKYRQHGHNVLGARMRGSYLLSKLSRISSWFRVYGVLFRALPFRVNYLKFIFWKCYYIVVRI